MKRLQVKNQLCDQEINQPAITSFFTKPPKRTATETDLPNTKPKKEKGKENLMGKIEKHDVRKLMPRKSIRTEKATTILEIPIAENENNV